MRHRLWSPCAQVLAILRLDPQQNTVIKVSTFGVARGICAACFNGVVATVYRESWDWPVSSGDVLDEAKGFLEDTVLVEAGATYFVVLRHEQGIPASMVASLLTPQVSPGKRIHRRKQEPRGADGSTEDA